MSAPDHPSQRPRILYLEDDTDLAEVVRHGLELFGFEVVWFGSGTEALQKICETREDFDLLLLDHNLTDMNGRQVAAKARSCGRTMPIVLLSGDTSPAESDPPDEAVNLHLHKPLGLTELVKALTPLLSPRK